MKTHTVYYYPTEPYTDINDYTHDYERDGWQVHQLVPVTRRRRVGDVECDECSLFVVYRKDTP